MSDPLAPGVRRLLLLRHGEVAAAAAADPGEPAWLAGLEVHVTPDREVRTSRMRTPATV